MNDVERVETARRPNEVVVMGMPIAAMDSQQLLEHITEALEAERGGWVVTANLDILLLFSTTAEAQRVYLAADLRVADGMPLVWASRLVGCPLPERVAGSTFSEVLIARCAERSWPVLLLGGTPDVAEKAARQLRERYTGAPVAAESHVRFSSRPTPSEVDGVVDLIRRQQSRVVLVGLGSPKQEFLIELLRSRLPKVWFIGVGGSFQFLSGDIPRAPRTLQRIGFEWLFRLAQEPGRLSRRYLLRDLPFFFRLMVWSLLARATRRVAS